MKNVAVGDRIAYLDGDVASTGIVDDVRTPARIGEQTTIAIVWDDGFEDTGLWVWPSDDLKLIRTAGA